MNRPRTDPVPPRVGLLFLFGADGNLLRYRSAEIGQAQDLDSIPPGIPLSFSLVPVPKKKVSDMNCLFRAFRESRFRGQEQHPNLSKICWDAGIFCFLGPKGCPSKQTLALTNPRFGSNCLLASPSAVEWTCFVNQKKHLE